METNSYQKEEIVPSRPSIKLEMLVSEILESISDDEILHLARLYLLNKYAKFGEGELLAEYARFNGIETKSELIERLKQY